MSPADLWYLNLGYATGPLSMVWVSDTLNRTRVRYTSVLYTYKHYGMCCNARINHRHQRSKKAAGYVTRLRRQNDDAFRDRKWREGEQKIARGYIRSLSRLDGPHVHVCKAFWKDPLGRALTSYQRAAATKRWRQNTSKTSLRRRRSPPRPVVIHHRFTSN